MLRNCSYCMFRLLYYAWYLKVSPSGNDIIGYCKLKIKTLVTSLSITWMIDRCRLWTPPCRTLRTKWFRQPIKFSIVDTSSLPTLLAYCCDHLLVTEMYLNTRISGVARIHVSPSLLFPRTRIPRDACFPTHRVRHWIIGPLVYSD